LRIAYIANASIPSRSASSIHVMKMCQAFARNGHAVTLVAVRESDGPESTMANVHAFYGVDDVFDLERISVGRRRGGNWRYAWRAVRVVETLRPDLVYSRHLAAAVLASLRGHPTVLELHGLRVARSLEDRLAFRALRRATALERLVVISEGLKADLLEAVPLDVNRILVSHDGADPVGEHDRPQALRGHPGRLDVGYVGHLYPGRGIELIREMAGRLPGMEFHLVGGQPADIARERAVRPGAANVHVHGFMPHPEAEAFRAHCDILIAPYQRTVMTLASRTDTSRWMSPLKVFEYMAAGKAIVCSDLPVLREALDHERTALLVQPDDLAAWVEALTCLERNADLRLRLGAAARQEFERRYTWQRRAQDVLEGIPAPAEVS